MSNNIFNSLLKKLSSEDKDFKLLSSVISAIENVEELKSLFGVSKVDSMMVSSETITDIPETFQIVFNLLHNKYRTVRIDDKKLTQTDKKNLIQIVERLDKSLNFILEIILSNKDYLISSPMFGNNLVQISMNEYLPKSSYEKIISILPSVQTDKNLLKNIYWLNMKIGKSLNIISEKMNSSWTMQDLLLIKSNDDSLELKEYGVVYFELLSMKLNTEKMSVNQICDFVDQIKEKSFFASRRPEVCEFAQNLILKMKDYLTPEELDEIHNKYLEANTGNKHIFNIQNIMKLTLLKHINKEQVINTLVESIRRDNLLSGFNVLSSLMHNYRDEGSVDKIMLIANDVPRLNNFKDTLDKLNVTLKESELMELLMKDLKKYPQVREVIKIWALNTVLNNEIPINVVKSGKRLKF